MIPTVRVEGLTVYRGSYAAVEEVSFNLDPGTDTAIVGPNGSGKSTLVLALLGLIPRSAGRIDILGCPLERLESLRSQIGYVPQDFVFDRGFPLSVREMVSLGWPAPRIQWQGWSQWGATLPQAIASFPFPWQIDLEKTAAVNRALERVDAYHLRHRPIGTLSTGQLKRVLLAYCLVVPRKLLILDEAFAGVDAHGEADFYHLLGELKQEQQWTILQVSHDLEMVNRHCDRVLCLNRKLICYGQPEVALSPQNLLAAYGPAFSRYHHHH
ncbi:MAG: metal ABC transporter ATP-binding protein [Leptolyngbyaceae cyanobacterium bins.59]|nr:metal ABC transporter ATP-binding protein [Leptolyngbyaceae cyanobacterium bins.59]